MTPTSGPAVEGSPANVHQQSGGDLVEAVARMWAAHHGLQTLTADLQRSHVPDIVIAVETFAPGCDEAGNVVDAQALARAVGDMVLARALKLGDEAAWRWAANKAVECIARERFEGAGDEQSTRAIAEEACRRAREILCDPVVEDMEAPLPIAELVELSVLEVMAGATHGSGDAASGRLQQLMDDKRRWYDSLVGRHQRISAVEDRVWHLLHYLGYCTAIKTAFLTLRRQELTLLAFRYYNNEQVPGEDTLEAFGFIGLLSPRGTVYTSTNLDTSLHRVLRGALQPRLIESFARAIERILAAPAGRALGPYLSRYADPGQQAHGVVTQGLKQLCEQQLGGGSRLMGVELLGLCRELDKAR